MASRILMLKIEGQEGSVLSAFASDMLEHCAAEIEHFAHDGDAAETNLREYGVEQVNCRVKKLGVLSTEVQLWQD